MLKDDQRPKLEPMEPPTCPMCRVGKMKRFVPVEGKAEVDPDGTVHLFDLEEVRMVRPVILECPYCEVSITERYFDDIVKNIDKEAKS